MLIDYINGAFECLSGFFVLNHCRAVMRDKMVAGVSIASVCFFTLWGFWNLYYYPQLGQLYSFIGGLFIVTANSIYIYLLFKYRTKPIKKTDKPIDLQKMRKHGIVHDIEQ